MLRTALLTTAAVLAFAACSLTLACSQTCKCDGDLCINCSGTTVSTQPPDAGDQAAIDATSESAAQHAGADANVADSPGERSKDASAEDALSTTTDAGDGGVDGCVCSGIYGPCGVANGGCGCCPWAGHLYCSGNGVCVSPSP